MNVAGWCPTEVCGTESEWVSWRTEKGLLLEEWSSEKAGGLSAILTQPRVRKLQTRGHKLSPRQLTQEQELTPERALARLSLFSLPTALQTQNIIQFHRCSSLLTVPTSMASNQNGTCLWSCPGNWYVSHCPALQTPACDFQTWIQVLLEVCLEY